MELGDTELSDFRQLLQEQLGRRDFNAVGLAKDVQRFVDAAGSDAAPRRARLRQVVGCAAMTYRQTMMELCR